MSAVTPSMNRPKGLAMAACGRRVERHGGLGLPALEPGRIPHDFSLILPCRGTTLASGLGRQNDAIFVFLRHHRLLSFRASCTESTKHLRDTFSVESILKEDLTREEVSVDDPVREFRRKTRRQCSSGDEARIGAKRVGRRN